ncbi:UDP-N-acetylmuramate dehydrogenase [Treponema sp.]|uniref:UDP-N-acetylmuramate dehydrogenase n=1 Tax=Treponema sp. TaxID=166 RepID=UPI00388E6B82
MKDNTEPFKIFTHNKSFSGSIKENESLSIHTTMNVGGKAGLFLEPEDTESLVFAVKTLTENKMPFFILGGGSNVIISSYGLDTVISTRKINKISSDSSERIKIECGASWGSVISFCKNHNYGGFEAFTGLSGTCGGALYMNATCFNLSACDNLVSAEYFDMQDMQLHIYEKKSSDWGYKKSPFQCSDYHQISQLKIILSAVFCIHNGFDSAFSEKCLAFRKEKGHFRSPSAGSVFKNDADKGIIAGKLIDECGLKGLSSGGAQIAPWHGNFIINPERKASAEDIKNLVEKIKKIVLEKKEILLENEIIFVEK